MSQTSSTNDWPFPDSKQPQFRFSLRNTLVVPMVGTFSKLFYGSFIRHETHNEEAFLKIFRSDKKRPFITVSNHMSCLDDPIVWGFLRWRELCSAKKMRWALAAHDICFTNSVYSWLFSSGKCIPVVRGKGVYQRGMNFCLARLGEGHWVHIFPEGKVNANKEYIRLKWGVGRLVYECPETPIVLPIYHMGMDAVLPNRTPYILRLMKKVTVVFGDPIDFREMVSRLRLKKVDDAVARKAITDVIQTELFKLRKKAEELHQFRMSDS